MKYDFVLTLPPFTFAIKNSIKFVYDNAKRIYADAFVDASIHDDFIDFSVSITDGGGLRGLVKPQARFFCDDREPFKPLDFSQAYALLEWGMNWAVAAHEFSYVIIHSAVLAKDGKAVLFPAPPGSGKSTLTAYLSQNGWRLLSDEMALITPHTKTVTPFVRPICLKNNSIDLVKSWYPEQRFSSIARDTHKGDVVHMAPSKQALAANTETAEIVGVVFPNYKPETQLDIYQLNMVEAYMQLVDNAFNFIALGEPAFDTVTQLIENTKTFEIFYNDLQEVNAFLLEDVLT
ncbi:HprK-related kinase A [Agaribacter flavus]|uniref:HprK-related kinase A n=1 Tax=Agaribacter flavus TaxID=1902781 RepID=A0ABV7FS52_9ALTE